MKCPKCQFPDTYRKSPFDLTVYCDRCGYQWQAKQPLKPILSKTFWTSEGLRGRHIISVWYCPTDSTKYSWSWEFNNSLPHRFDEFPEDPYLSGCFSTPEEALKAGRNNAFK